MNNSTNTTVYISNLSYKRDRNGLRSLFASFGKIINIKIIVEPKSNQSRGMAFVEMATHKEAMAAIEGLDQQVIDGRTIKTSWATPQSIPVKKNNVPKKEKTKDLNYKEIQLAKKAKNDAKRKSNPFQFKLKK